MGRAKPLLPLGASDFLGVILQTLHHHAPELTTVVVIRREGDVPLAERLDRVSDPRLRVTTVDDGPGDMLRSLRAGTTALGDARGALVWPVDVPAVTGSTVEAVVGTAVRQPNRVVMPRQGHRTGHPTYVPRALLSAEAPPDASPGLRGILLAGPEAPMEVAVEDPFSLWNVNTPGDYQKLLAAYS